MTALVLLAIIALVGIVYGHPAQMALERKDYQRHYED